MKLAMGGKTCYSLPQRMSKHVLLGHPQSRGAHEITLMSIKDDTSGRLNF